MEFFFFIWFVYYFYTHVLVNFLSGTDKLAIWLTYRNQGQRSGSVELVPVLKELLKA